MKRVFCAFLCLILCSFSLLVLPVMAETNKLLFVCEKPEYASSEALKWFVKSKEALGFETQLVVSPDVFNSPEAFRKLIGEGYFVVYAIGVLKFAESPVVKDYPFPISKIKWDAPYWWPGHEFIDRFYLRSVPNEPPTIVARIHVNNASELESWIVIPNVVSRELNGMFASARILNQQKSKLFPHFEYDEVSDTYSHDDFKGFKILSEKRGKSSQPGEQLSAASFKTTFSSSNLAVISSTADRVQEVYYKKEDMLFPVAKTRDVFATAYLDQGTNIKEETFFSESEGLGKNRVILLTNFYNEPSDLDFVFNVSRCVVTNYPGGLFFDVTHNNRSRLYQEILKKFINGEMLAVAIQDVITESRVIMNEAKFDFVVWGDPLITRESLSKADSLMDIGFLRSFSFSKEKEVDFVNLPDFLSFVRDGEVYRFKCSIPPVAFFLFGDLVLEKSFLLEFQEKETGQKGWIFLKLKILNLWGIPKSPFYIVFNYFFCYNIFVGFN